jgi:simple sugar transport system permease protein
VISGEDVLTSTGTSAAVLSLSLPIAMAGLGGLVSERAGVVNIGLEGMMILGTWGAAGPATSGGRGPRSSAPSSAACSAALLHAVATVTFGVDHIVSGVAINLLAAGLVRFLSEIALRRRPRRRPDAVADDLRRRAVVRRPAAGLGTGPARRAGGHPDRRARGRRGRAPRHPHRRDAVRRHRHPADPGGWFLLWRTALGLRWRSAGENPYAAESLGVNVYRVKYLAVVTSGALAGLGGLFIVLFSGLYKEGQTVGAATSASPR